MPHSATLPHAACLNSEGEVLAMACDAITNQTFLPDARTPQIKLGSLEDMFTLLSVPQSSSRPGALCMAVCNLKY